MGLCCFWRCYSGVRVVNAIAGNAPNMNGMQDVPVAPVIILDIKELINKIVKS
ncbi:MAG: hypothetical protein CM1200mP17_14140 [Woeseia sp.]|nr:MAG: hypothetical protein CM1200mP17_14140 [Woeseia sp.]